MVDVGKQPPFKLRLSGRAGRDLVAIGEWSSKKFGEAAALRYQALVGQALRDLQADPIRPGSKEWPELMVRGARTYHLALSRDHVADGRVKEPRHLVIYRYRNGVVEIGRILHDSRDLKRHLPSQYRLAGE
jgi:toxin ParE1/3/4